MSSLRFIGINIILVVLLTSCSQKISQLEYDRKSYEYTQLKIRYDLLQQEVDGGLKKTSNETPIKVSSDVNIAEYEALQLKYETLLNENLALESAYNESRTEINTPSNVKKTENNQDYETLKIKYDALLSENLMLKNAHKDLETTENTPKEATLDDIKAEEIQTNYDALKTKYDLLVEENVALENNISELEKKQKPSKKSNAPGTIPVKAYNELKIEKADIEKRYAILENRYNDLKKSSLANNSSSIGTAEMIEPTEINPEQNIGKGIFESEENSIDLGSRIVHSASYNGLFFEFDTYDRTNDYLVLDIAVKNNSQTDLKTFWNTDKIEITDQYSNVYTAKSFRVGVDYANDKNGTLSKKINEDNTVFARFAFEDLPKDLKQITNLQFIVSIDGEMQMISFTQIDISTIEAN